MAGDIFLIFFHLAELILVALVYIFNRAYPVQRRFLSVVTAGNVTWIAGAGCVA